MTKGRVVRTRQIRLPLGATRRHRVPQKMSGGHFLHERRSSYAASWSSLRYWLRRRDTVESGCLATPGRNHRLDALATKCPPSISGASRPPLLRPPRPFGDKRPVYRFAIFYKRTTILCAKSVHIVLLSFTKRLSSTTERKRPEIVFRSFSKDNSNLFGAE